jgi:hypothetical protein
MTLGTGAFGEQHSPAVSHDWLMHLVLLGNHRQPLPDLDEKLAHGQWFRHHSARAST